MNWKKFLANFYNEWFVWQQKLPFWLAHCTQSLELQIFIESLSNQEKVNLLETISYLYFQTIQMASVTYFYYSYDSLTVDICFGYSNVIPCVFMLVNNFLNSMNCNQSLSLITSEDKILI